MRFGWNLVTSTRNAQCFNFFWTPCVIHLHIFIRKPSECLSPLSVTISRWRVKIMATACGKDMNCWRSNTRWHPYISGVSCSWAMMYDKPASSQSVSFCAVATAMQEIHRRRALQLPSIFRKTADVGEQLPQQRACSAVPEITQCDPMSQWGRMHLALLQCTKKK